MKILIDYPCPAHYKPYRARNDRCARVLAPLEGEIAEIPEEAAPVAFEITGTANLGRPIAHRFFEGGFWRSVQDVVDALAGAQALRAPPPGHSDWRFFKAVGADGTYASFPTRLDIAWDSPTSPLGIEEWLAGSGSMATCRDRRVDIADGHKKLAAILARHRLVGGVLHVAAPGFPVWAVSSVGLKGTAEAVMAEPSKGLRVGGAFPSWSQVPFGPWTESRGRSISKHFSADALHQARAYLSASGMQEVKTLGSIRVLVPGVLPSDPALEAARRTADGAVERFAKMIEAPEVSILDDSDRMGVLRSALKGVLEAIKSSPKLSALEKVELLMVLNEI